MDNSLKREKIAEGVYFNSVTDPRHKFNSITVGFAVPLNEKTASSNSLITRLLSKTNAHYPEAKELNNFLASLYNAKTSFSASSYGDTQFISLSLTFMDDSYALYGEKITETAAQILLDCVFRPALENGSFKAADVESNKRELIEAIESELNEKRYYARKQATRIAMVGEPAAVNSIGSVEQTGLITPESLYRSYKELLKSAVIEIVCAGCNDFCDVLKKAREEFSAVERMNIVKCVSSFSPLKSAVTEKTERIQVNQSKMVIVFKTDSRAHYALELMSKIYGGTVSSKLFLNVREKLSLCYYCWASSADRNKGTLFVDCGVEETNIEKAKAEILLQLDMIKKGEFTDDELNSALLFVQNNLKSVYDSPHSLSWWYIIMIFYNEIKSPEEYLRNYDGITREDIIAAANSLKLDTVYVLSGLEKQEQEN